MDIINSNPYRIIGILSNVSERELQKQINKVRAYLKVGKEKEVEFDNDYKFLGLITRTESSINQALANIEKNQDKVIYSLFWFSNISSFDNSAIGHLKNGNVEKAIDIWEKVTAKEITVKNFSCFNNLATYRLLNKNKKIIQKGIEAKIVFIESDYFKELVNAITDETFVTNSKEQIEKFIDRLFIQFNQYYQNPQILELFENCNDATKKYISKKITNESIHKIENKIEIVKHNRIEKKLNAYKLGLKLKSDCINDLSTLKQTLGIDDLKYKMIADNLAEEILQCGIDYYEKLKMSRNVYNEVSELFEFALSIATGFQTKDRINEWIASLTINNEIELFLSMNSTIPNAKTFIESYKIKLKNIENTLGSNHESFIYYNSTVVNYAMERVVEIVNMAQDEFEHNEAKLNKFSSTITEAIEVVEMMKHLKKDSDTQYHYTQNRKTIRKIDCYLHNKSCDFRVWIEKALVDLLNRILFMVGLGILTLIVWLISKLF